MNANQLLAHFDSIADASDALPRLRHFILDLAVRGKLVPQDPEDEPATELLKRIAKERARLVKAGEIKESKVNPARMAEAPFELPRSWEWSALGELFFYDAGTKREPASLNQNLWLLELEDVEKDTGHLLARIQASGRESKSTKSEFRVGDILYGKLRPYLNKVIVAEEPGYSTTEIVALRPYLPICSQYCALALRRPDFVAYVTRLGQGTKMPRLRTEDAIIAPFPLPPLTEQSRIVAKVDELMAMCDGLEAMQTERETTRTRLTAASLARLNAPEPDEARFREDVAFTLDNFASLTTRPEQVKMLRRTILNLAVRGKLVPQDPEDEPAAELLKRIAKEKERANGFLKGLLPPVSENEQTFPIPKSWEWARLGNVSASLLGKTLNQAKNRGTYKPYLRSVNVYWLELKLSDVKQMKFEEEELEKYALRKDDVLVCEGGEAGRAAVWNDEVEGIYYQNALHRVRFFGKMDPNYFVFALCSDFNNRRLESYCTGVTIKHLTSKRLARYCFPVPPLDEQRRIVAKVDELMGLCDRLEESLTTGNDRRRQLLGALLH